MDAHLTITQKLALKPWFGSASLQEGARLLAGGGMEVLSYRHAAGVLFTSGETITAVLLFEPTDKIFQGFRLKEVRCSSCPPGKLKKDGKCAHLAALALALLDRCDYPDGQIPQPLPLLFPDGPWAILGAFLFEHCRQGTWRYGHGNGICRLEFFQNDRQVVDCRLPVAAAGQLFALFGRLLPETAIPPCSGPAAAIVNLFQILRRQTATDTEAALQARGLESQGVARDSSFWLWLSRRLAGELGPAAFRVERHKGADFSLSAGNPLDNSGSWLSVMPAREHAATLLAGLAPFMEKPLFLPPAQEFFRLELTADTNLRIVPCLRLADGRVFPRQELAAQRYGNYYYFEGEGFLAATPVRNECDLRPKAAEPANLFTAGRKQAERDVPVTVANHDIPAFIESHRAALVCPENEVDPDLFARAGCERPERLELVATDEDDHWHYLSGHYRIGNHRISLTALIEARRKGLSYLPGSGLRLTGTSLQWFHDLGPERLWFQNGELKGVRVSRHELLRLVTLIGAVDPPAGADDRLQRLLDDSHWQQTAALPEWPDHLRAYQRHGLAWLFHLHLYGLGGILADDMGLGKTHQALALLWLLSRQNGDRRFLVVCPVTVAPHWVAKLESFYPELSWHLYHGAQRDLAQALEKRVLVTTYGILRQDAAILAQTPFEVVVFDEMQQLKNNKTVGYQAAGRLQGRVIIGLSGTPLENSAQDLKALFDLCLPGLLGSDASFAKRYAAPALAEQGGRERQEELARLLNPFLLRRERSQVLPELPDIIDDLRTCELSSDQVGLYREAVGHKGEDLLARLATKESAVPYMDILALIGTLKQICNHPALLDTGDPDPTRCASGKWDLFVNLLEECLASSMKVVVFSQYTRMLDLIERHLAAAGIGFAGLRGKMDLKARERAIRRFNEDPACQVFCASLLAGGTGIDLTAAQAVIHYDRWWNAAKEDQATARVHRLGQRRVVQVFKLLTIGTLEEKINRLIESKRNLTEQLVRADDASLVKRLDRDDLAELLRWRG